ncbi:MULTISPECIES: hypothetical protein [Streptomyces]|uniref:hypothetical protein n=1 Tax=Streptomyces TaxID=1883 RepID=UPI000241B29E|nr:MULTISPECIES: hypothetical protein [Streptomyces]EHM26393.1 hypothetical protein SPW_5181 [Streptomyces sp. W007]WSI81336.1 hypothetical protein OG557_32295 [Streptomyces anulatus]WTD24311.1 hypothetical protein OH737_07210 [Streptomyces anulatus]
MASRPHQQRRDVLPHRPVHPFIRADGLIGCCGLATVEEFERKLRSGRVATSFPRLIAELPSLRPSDGPATSHAPAVHLPHSYELSARRAGIM